MASSVMEQFSCETRILGPAEILEVDSAGHRLRLRLAGSDDDLGVWARIAMAAEVLLSVGDEVLVVGETPRDLYVIGVLGTLLPNRLVTQGGAYATVAASPEAQTLRVFSGRNELLFEYDEAKRRARIHVDHGDLEFVTKDGNIVLSSARGVVIQGDSVRVSGERGDIQLSQTNLSGTRLQAHYKEAKVVSDRFEAVFQTLTERAKNAFRTIEQLAQTKAGRIRTLVDSTYFFKARRAFVKSDEDYKIRAEKIHLG